jgi:hypothetical protein
MPWPTATTMTAITVADSIMIAGSTPKRGTWGSKRVEGRRGSRL